MDEALKAWLTLSLTHGLGGEGARKLLRALGSPEAVLEAPLSALRELVRPSLAEALKRPSDSDKLAEITAWLEDASNHIVTLADQDYPQALLNIPDPPLLLYVKGRLDLLNRPAIGVIGSRNATAQGKQNAEAFSRAMSDAGLCVVSGLAHGIDAAAHRGALAGRGSSIGVIGTGLDKVYPAAHRELAHAMAGQGALISEFPLGTPPLAANFPRRNRIISGLSLGCLIVEAGLQSGSLITARLALEQGREVFAIPGSIHSPQSRGCHALIKQGAKLVETAQDVLDEIGGFFTGAGPAEVDAAEDPFLEFLGFDPVDIDTLAQRAGLTMAELSAMLLTLELGGRVAVLPGGLYQRIH
ncbi:MAG: DNA-processing protein DprA [Gallionella sp.]|jgi:DNA processing protein|nr:DNA-processing protein DprA [Gallionella sp.]